MSDKIYNIQEISSLCKPIFNDYNIKDVSIFGSYARGEAVKTSDVDFLITPPSGFSLIDLYSLESDLEDKLNKKVDIVSNYSFTRDMNKEISQTGILAKQLFYNQILKERKTLYD